MRPNLIVRMLARLSRPVVVEAMRLESCQRSIPMETVASIRQDVLRLDADTAFSSVDAAREHAQAHQDFIGRMRGQVAENSAEAGPSQSVRRLTLALRVLTMVEETLGDEPPREGAETLLIAIHALTDASYRSGLLTGRG